MTREEAIKYLIQPVSTSTIMSDETTKQFEAYRMAVKALWLDPITHAHWIEMYNGDWICSNCDNILDKSEDLNYIRYCSWCGAKMDEEPER